MSGGADSSRLALDCEKALEALPHAAPFRFLTRLIVLEPGVRAQGIWGVRGDEAFLRGHFPGNPLVPGVLIGEALAQVSGTICCSPADLTASHKGMLAHLDLRFLHAVTPPADIVLKSELSRSLDRLHQFRVEAMESDRVIARGLLALVIEPDSIERESSP
jgi:3-hydroxyacyl-[acyl-carrier-protein] dehydratase